MKSVHGYRWPMIFNNEGGRLYDFPPGSILGPVHQHFDCDTYRAVLVPAPVPEAGDPNQMRLLWVNVYDFRTRVRFAYPVSEAQTRSWHALLDGQSYLNGRGAFAPADLERQSAPWAD